MLSLPHSDQVVGSSDALLAAECQPGAQAVNEAMGPDNEFGDATTVILPEYRRMLPMAERPAEVRRVAIDVFSQTSSWVTLYRLILGADGVARQLYPSTAEYRRWEATPEFFEIHEMIAALRGDDDQKSGGAEPLRMITIRLPLSLHEGLKREAAERAVSINKLCLSKMLMGIEDRFVPEEKGLVRGRKPGAQPRRKPK